jgi:hypothetical protein
MKALDRRLFPSGYQSSSSSSPSFPSSHALSKRRSGDRLRRPEHCQWASQATSYRKLTSASPLSGHRILNHFPESRRLDGPKCVREHRSRGGSAGVRGCEHGALSKDRCAGLLFDLFDASTTETLFEKNFRYCRFVTRHATSSRFLC